MSETVNVYFEGYTQLAQRDFLLSEHDDAIATLVMARGDDIILWGVSIPASKLYAPVETFTAYFYGYGSETSTSHAPWTHGMYFDVNATLDPRTATWNKLPLSYYLSKSTNDLTLSPTWMTVGDTEASVLRLIISKGLYIDVSNYGSDDTRFGYIYTPLSGQRPYIAIRFGDGACHQIISTAQFALSPASGARVNRAIAQKFNVKLAVSINTSLYAPGVASVKLRLRAKGAATYTEVDFGTETSKAVAGNLLPEGAFEYQFAVTDALDYTSTSDWVELSSYVSITTSHSPADGAFLDRTKPQLFSWTTVDGATITKLRLRKKGETEYTEYAVANSTDGYTLAANVMTGGEYEWAVVGNDQYGNSWVTAWRTIDTTDAVSAAAPVSPISTIVDNDNPVAFAWQHIISTGSSQTKADLQKSADGETWETLTTVTGAETETVIAAGAITSGTWWWRVRTYNLDGVAGKWSAAAQFVAIGSPGAPILTVKDVSPRPVIEWQASEQEAYELTLDGDAITVYGAAKRWQSPKYLSGGVHIVSVRVQNSYGRWSRPGTTELTVINTPGESIQLTAQAEGATENLKWNSGGYDYYLVYRDDVAIARVTETEYLDYLSCGLCTYRVRGCYTANNNYGISDPVTVEAYPRCPVIIDVETRAALWLELSDQQHRTYSMARARQATSYHIVGQARPSVDVSEFVDETLTVSAAFWADDRAGMRALEALLGRVVCLKTDSGEMATGVLTSIAKTVDMFYTSYQLAVTNTELEEEVRE